MAGSARRATTTTRVAARPLRTARTSLPGHLRVTGLPPGGAILPPSFYRRPVLRVAKDLLGKYFVRVNGRAVLAGRIVEVEAYRGRDDPASHAYRGRSKRNEVMFREGGRLYVYFTYGMHFCANVVTGREGTGSAVLIRALEPVAGLTRMTANRLLGARSPSSRRMSPRMITSGPARLCRAMRIGRKQNGLGLAGPEFFIMSGPAARPAKIGTSPRIGISAGTDKLWRFFIPGNAYLSRG